jgi:acetyl-CoA carboxylase biotin carboxylase subunit
MLAKVIAWANDRHGAIDTLDRALGHLHVDGVSTTAGFARDVLAHPDMRQGRIHTRWIEETFMPAWGPQEVAV